MESATLKESPFLIGRIAMADHSPNAGSTRASESGECSARHREARGLSVAAHQAPAFGEPARPTGESKRKYPQLNANKRK